jgi:hypothetical protein
MLGIYILNNKFLHASTSNGVTISDLNENYWKQHYRACGRVFKRKNLLILFKVLFIVFMI